MPSLRSKAIVDSKATKELEAARLRIASLEKLVEKQIEQIESFRKPRFKLPVGVKNKTSKNAFCRVVIPDTHGCVTDALAIAAFLGDLESINPTEIVMLGDHLECGGFLAQHHTLGYVAQTEYTFEDDVIACNDLLDRIQKLAPRAGIDYICGNHERRLESWIVNQVVKNRQDGEYLRKMFSVDSVLSLGKRGIRSIEQGIFYDGLSVPSTIKKGYCHFTHGSSTAMHSASVHVKKFGGNVVYGHTHRVDSYVIRTVNAGSIGAWCPGCLCKLQPLWQHTNPTDWSHGYGLQLVNTDGTFLHINVPIIDGRSYLQPLVKAIA
jgi:hypothetical protein